MKTWVLGITGASGVVYGMEILKHLLQSNYSVHAVLSESARIVFHEEMDVNLKGTTDRRMLQELLGVEYDERQFVLHSPKNFGAEIASGSFPVNGMVIAPCSMGTLGCIASGVSQHLIHRAADCVLKESKRLVLVPRETPLNAIHLENMLKLSRLGVRIVPPMAGFYSGVKSIEDMIDFTVGKILDQMDVPHALYPRWTGLVKK